MGKVVIEEVELFREVVGQLNKKFIAFDTETTGFSPYKDRIIELGAVLFINNKETAYFNSLVKTDVKNSYHAYKVNNISEEIELAKTIYNYKLGTTWVLGRKPFSEQESGGVIKLATTPSIQQEFLNDIASFSASDINNVLLNDTEVISSFSTKTSTNNIATIEYTVPSSLGIAELINIKLRDADNNILTSSNVYVPIVEDVIIKHNIYVKEGA